MNTEDTNLNNQAEQQDEIIANRNMNGAAAAALLAAAIGCAVLGIFTALAHVIAPLKSFLNFYPPAGPLSGKTAMGVLAWLVSWPLLHYKLKNTNVCPVRLAVWTGLLFLIAYITSYPIFEHFGH